MARPAKPLEREKIYKNMYNPNVRLKCCWCGKEFEHNPRYNSISVTSGPYGNSATISSVCSARCETEAINSGRYRRFSSIEFD